MALSEDDVRHVAKLAQLQLQPSEVSALTRDLAQILEHIDQLRELDTEGIEATHHVGVEAMPLRADASRPGLNAEAALEPSARTLDGGFAVPAFVE